MLMRFDPFQEMDRLWPSGRPEFGQVGLLAMDAYRDQDQVIIHLDAPGVLPEDIDITVEQDQLRVSASRSWDDNGRAMILRERTQGTTSRSLYLGEALDAGKMEARLEDGVLTISIPVTESAKPRQISVKKGGGEAKPIEASSSDGPEN
jgi:HSP20 family protein